MPLPVISVAQMREWEERTWASGVSAESVMKNAGEAVAKRAGDLAEPDEPLIIFLIGKGNNGGDDSLKAEVAELKDRVEKLEKIIKNLTKAFE